MRYVKEKFWELIFLVIICILGLSKVNSLWADSLTQMEFKDILATTALLKFSFAQQNITLIYQFHRSQEGIFDTEPIDSDDALPIGIMIQQKQDDSDLSSATGI